MQYGPNSVRSVQRHGVLAKVGRQLRDPMIALLLGAMALTALQGDIADLTIIAMVVVLNTAVGVLQEVRAERAITALHAMAAPHARVLRDGAQVVVPTIELVPGDILLLEAGDIVGADAEVLEGYLLQSDDSALTGESVPVDKQAGSTVSAGTTLTRGRGRAVVTGTGESSGLGRIAAMVADARPGPTPMQRRLTRLGQQLTVAAVVVSGLVFVLALLRGMGWSDAALTAVSLAVAAVPESLPAVLTLSLAIGAHRMARRSAIARELRAVETLGSVNLLATDKTGTLTENRMVVERCWTPAGEYAVIGEGYNPDGRLEPRSAQGDDVDLPRLLRDISLCNDADVVRDEQQHWCPLGDPTEAALVTLARRGGLDVAKLRREHPRVQEVPFDSERAWMATQHEAPQPGGHTLVVVKGAPEALLQRIDDINAAAAARSWADARAAEGYRVLLVADAPAELRDDDVSVPLQLAGLVAMTDPPRGDVPAVLAGLHDAGIRVVVMTGDHPATADAISRRVGLLADNQKAGVRTGSELNDIAPGDLANASFMDATVFARVRPEHKLALVEAWQQQGYVVAVTGDGVNDGPALRTAAIGVAMGSGGTEVARQAADLVLTDDRLATVVHAVEEGRRIYDNLRRFLRYALSGGLAEVAYMLAAPLFGFLIPLLPGQILWINMLTHGLPGVAMGAEPVTAGAMQRPPVPTSARVIDASLARRIGVTGLIIAVVTLSSALLARQAEADPRTSAFLVLGLAQLGVALALRERGAARQNPFLTVAVVVAAMLQIAGVVLPPLQSLLDTHDLPTAVWVWSIVLSALPGLALWLAKRFR